MYNSGVDINYPYSLQGAERAPPGTNRVTEAVPLLIFLATSEVEAFCMRHIKFGGSWFQAEIRKTRWPRKTVIFENTIFSEINRGTASHYPYSPQGG